MEKAPKTWNEFFKIFQNEEFCLKLNDFLNKEYREKEITPPIFTTPKSLYHFVVTEELKNALIKYKISNVEFDEAFLCTREEYKEWQDSRRLAKCRGKQ